MSLFAPVKYPHSQPKGYQRFASLKPANRFDEIIGYITDVKEHFVKDYYGPDWERELGAYVAYALSESLDNPTEEVKSLLRHLHEKYAVTRERVNTVAADIQMKIENNDPSKVSTLP